MASAQDYETAGETPDASGVPHGVFSSAFVSVLRAAAPDEPATRIFQQVKAIMQSQGRAQEPVAGGDHRATAATVAGRIGSGGQTTVAVLRPSAPGQVELQGGAAIGLRENTELIPYGGRSGNASRSPQDHPGVRSEQLHRRGARGRARLDSRRRPVQDRALGAPARRRSACLDACPRARTGRLVPS